MDLPRVHIVEHHGRLRQQLVREMERDFRLVDATGSAAAALATLATRPTGLLIIDMSLPGTGALELGARAIKLSPGIRLIFLSASAGADTVCACLAAGATAVVVTGRLSRDLRPAAHNVLHDRVFVSRGERGAG